MITDSDIAKEVLRLQTRDGVCAPQTLVNENSDPSAPLHGLFDWDDTTAANSHRLHQAARAITRVKIIVNDTPTPAHVSVAITLADGTKRRGYVPIEVAQSDHDLTLQIISDARTGLQSWRNRLAAIETATGAITHINAAIDTLDMGSKA